MHPHSADKVSSSESTCNENVTNCKIHSVVYIAPFGLGQKTTVWARILPLAQELARREINTTILIPPWDTTAHAGLRWNDGGASIDNVRLDGGPAAILGRLLRRVQRLKPDIIHIVKPTAYAGAMQSLLWTIPALGSANSKIVLDIDDWEQAWAELNGRSLFVRRIITGQENWGLTHAHGITAASQWLVEQVNQKAQNKIPTCYLPNGVAPTADDDTTQAYDDTAWGTPTDSPGVLFFTRFIEVTPDWLATFATTLLESKPTATLHIAGSGVLPALEHDFKQAFTTPTIQAYIEQNRIRWEGHVRIDALRRLYESCACAVFPAQETPLQQAKCSVRLATTLLHGIPTVATAVGEQTHYGEAGGVKLLAPHAAPEAYAQAVMEILAEPEPRLSAQRAARPHLLQQYNWRTLGKRLLDFYQSL